MDDRYFAEFKTGVNNAWKVGLSNWVIYNGLLPAVPAGPVPASPFRVAVTLSAVAGHIDTAGSVFVNREELVFTRAARLTNSLELIALPTIATIGLDCNILVECISSGGAPLKKESLKAIEIICFPNTQILRDPSGSGWMQTSYDIWSEEPLSIGNQIRYPDPHQGGRTIDIYVKNVSSAVDLEYQNAQPFRVYNCA
jgi:hypothetical protein